MVTSSSAAICQVSPSHVRSAMANSAGLINVNAVSRRALRSHFAPNRVPQPRSRYFACTSSWHRVQSLCRSFSQSASHIVRSRSQYRPQVVPGISDSKNLQTHGFGLTFQNVDGDSRHCSLRIIRRRHHEWIPPPYSLLSSVFRCFGLKPRVRIVVRGHVELFTVDDRTVHPVGVRVLLETSCEFLKQLVIRSVY